MYRLAIVFVALLLVPASAGAAIPATPTITEPAADGLTLNPADVHMEAGGFSDPDGDAHACSDWEIRTVSPAETVWEAPCATGLEAVHAHFGDGTFVNSHAGRSELDFETDHVLRVRFHDSAGEVGDWAERPFVTSPAGPPGTPAPVPWAARQPGFEVEVVATGFQLPVNIAFVPNPGTDPGDPFLYVTELYGAIKVVTRDGTVGDYATGLLNFNPTGAFPGSGEQGVAGIAIDPGSGDVIATLLYEDTASTATPKPHYPKVVRFHSTDGGRTAATQTTLLDMFGESMGQSHQISNVTIGPDGKLYVHMGDGFTPATAQNLSSFRGKVLRMNLDGTAPGDNPFYDNSDGITARDFVFAYGFRNPFGGTWRAADSAHYEVENGPSVDRFTKIVPGRNYLWDGTNASMQNFALYNWPVSHAPVNIAMVEPQTFFGSAFPGSKMDHAFVTESGPTWATGPQVRGKRIVDFEPRSGGDFAGALPTPLVEYTGTGKATAAGLAAGPDGLYFTDLYKDVGFTSPIDRGANVLRVRYREPSGYPRPSSASPLRAALVPAYRQCVAPDRTHGPPLAHPSCAAPQPTSDHLTVGTPDANGRPASSAGFLRLATTVGDPSTGADEADVQIGVSLKDVRDKDDLADYPGELQAELGVRLTDRLNGPALDTAATAQDFAFAFAVPCAVTGGTGDVGSTCTLATTADALVPGAVTERKRALWQLDRVTVLDGGEDGAAATTPNSLFAVQGVFVP